MDWKQLNKTIVLVDNDKSSMINMQIKHKKNDLFYSDDAMWHEIKIFENIVCSADVISC